MYRKILAPLDGSELSECSLQHLTAIAIGCHAPEVVILRVVEPLSSSVISALAEAGVTGEDFLAKAEKQSIADAESYISKLSQELKKDGITAQAVVLQGKPADVILDYAKKNQVDLIVMSTHGRSGVSRWVMGSVADKIVRFSQVPVLTVSPPGCRIS